MLEEEEKLSFLFLLLPGRLVILLSSLLCLSFLVRGSTDFSDFTAPDSCAMMQRLPGKQVTDADIKLLSLQILILQILILMKQILIIMILMMMIIAKKKRQVGDLNADVANSYFYGADAEDS